MMPEPSYLFGWSIVNLVLCLIGRVFDILSTAYCTPSLELEGNPLIKRLGWKKAILYTQVPAIIIGSFSFMLALMIFLTGVIVSSFNLLYSWTIFSHGGEKQYLEVRKAQLIKVSKYRIFMSCFPIFILLGCMGLFVLIFLSNTTALLVFSITCMISGLLLFALNYDYTIKLRASSLNQKKEQVVPSNEDNNNDKNGEDEINAD